MSMYACQQKALVGCVEVGETGRAADISVSNGVVCPKPRKLGLFNYASVNSEEPIRPCQLLQFSRAGNPLIQDAQFGNHNFVPILPIQERAVAPSPPPPSSTIMSGGGCVRVKFGNKPAPVRIEGFNCRGNCSISAVA
ncbi:unnamed protein product [Withania somnifera]